MECPLADSPYVDGSKLVKENRYWILLGFAAEEKEMRLRNSGRFRENKHLDHEEM